MSKFTFRAECLLDVMKFIQLVKKDNQIYPDVNISMNTKFPDVEVTLETTPSEFCPLTDAGEGPYFLRILRTIPDSHRMTETFKDKN